MYMANKSIEKVYEIGLHLIPTIEEEKVSEVFGHIKEVIEKGGETVSDENPVRQDLAYTIRHAARQSDSSYNTYNEAYFGSIKFKASREFVKELHKDVKEDENVLRFIILETAEDDTRIGDVLPGTETEEENTGKSGTEKGTSGDKEDKKKDDDTAQEKTATKNKLSAILKS